MTYRQLLSPRQSAASMKTSLVLLAEKSGPAQKSGPADLDTCLPQTDAVGIFDSLHALHAGFGKRGDRGEYCHTGQKGDKSYFYKIHGRLLLLVIVIPAHPKTIQRKDDETKYKGQYSGAVKVTRRQHPILYPNSCAVLGGC